MRISLCNSLSLRLCGIQESPNRVANAHEVIGVVKTGKDQSARRSQI